MSNDSGSDPATPPVARRIEAPPGAVWAVLADGWLYATWVVGASRVRDVDLDWPTEGSRIHHSVGSWPALLSDETVVLDAQPGRRLRLTARGWPVGEAHVDLEIVPVGTTASEVRLAEDAVSGPALLVPQAVRQPLLQLRNRETLRRLAFLAEGRHREAVSGR